MSSAILDMSDLTLSYTTLGRKLRALQGVSLSVGEGEAVGLVGESGSGKSTVARVALGLTPAGIAHIEAGCIRINGRDVTHLRGCLGDAAGTSHRHCFPRSIELPQSGHAREPADCRERRAPHARTGGRSPGSRATRAR